MLVGEGLREDVRRQHLHQPLHNAPHQHLGSGNVPAVEHLQEMGQQLRQPQLGHYVDHDLGELQHRPPNLSIRVLQQHQHDSDEPVLQVVAELRAMLVQNSAQRIHSRGLRVPREACKARGDQSDDLRLQLLVQSRGRRHLQALARGLAHGGALVADVEHNLRQDRLQDLQVLLLDPWLRGAWDHLFFCELQHGIRARQPCLESCRAARLPRLLEGGPQAEDPAGVSACARLLNGGMLQHTQDRTVGRFLQRVRNCIVFL
mmetsp:Transcript_27269/g.68977  ORF Transcript_27269/g.68977 Transcript_27269/m.68977 type:complete len:260 (-) Transcript_27269:137-916(-)